LLICFYDFLNLV